MIGTVLLVKSIIESNERQNIETNCLKVTRLMIIDKRIEVENDSIEIYTSLQNRDNIIYMTILYNLCVFNFTVFQFYQRFIIIRKFLTILGHYFSRVLFMLLFFVKLNEILLTIKKLIFQHFTSD